MTSFGRRPNDVIIKNGGEKRVCVHETMGVSLVPYPDPLLAAILFSPVKELKDLNHIAHRCIGPHIYVDLGTGVLISTGGGGGGGGISL